MPGLCRSLYRISWVKSINLFTVIPDAFGNRFPPVRFILPTLVAFKMPGGSAQAAASHLIGYWEWDQVNVNQVLGI